MSRTFAALILLTLLAAAAPPADRNEPKLKPVELDSLPGKLKESIAKQKGSEEVTQVVEITRGPRTVYRVRVENAELNKARFIILGPTGEVLRELDLTRPGATPVKWDSLPGDVKSAFAKKAPADQYQQFTRVLRNAQIFYVGIPAKGDPVRVDESGNYVEREGEPPAKPAPDRYVRQPLTYDDLPGPVKGTIGQNGGDKDAVAEAFRITRGDELFYRVTLKSNERLRMLRVAPDGSIESERNATPDGKVKVKVASLPGPLKSGIYKVANQPPEEVWQVTQDSNTWYVIELDDRLIGLDDAGAVIRTEPKPGR
jgi:hypothetical protein